jgi:pantetheine-phosphate adenylyltransferase
VPRIVRPRDERAPGHHRPGEPVFDEVIVAVLVNESKRGLFTIDERLEMLREVTKPYENVRIEAFQGLLVDFCRAQQATRRGQGPARRQRLRLRELQMAQMNIGLAGVETLFMPTNPQHSYLSSSLVKDVAKWGGDVTPHVPEVVARRLADRLRPSAR